MSNDAPITVGHFKRILAATDGSNGAAAALRSAADLAALTHAELAVLNVLQVDEIASLHDPEPREFARVEHLRGDYAEAKEVMAESILADAKKIVNEWPGLGASFVVLEGDPATEILRYAGEIAADTIVIGRRGRGRLPGLIWGSVSQKIASHAPMTTIIVPHEK